MRAKGKSKKGARKGLGNSKNPGQRGNNGKPTKGGSLARKMNRQLEKKAKQETASLKKKIINQNLK